MFVIGDRVVSLRRVGYSRKDNIGYYGTIINIFDDGETFTVEFDDDIEGHDGAPWGAAGRDGHCWNVDESFIELVESARVDYGIECCYEFEIDGHKGEFLRRRGVKEYGDTSMLAFVMDGQEYVVKHKGVLRLGLYHYIKTFCKRNGYEPYVFDLKTGIRYSLNSEMMYAYRNLCEKNERPRIKDGLLFVDNNKKPLEVVGDELLFVDGNEFTESDIKTLKVRRKKERYRVLERISIKKIIEG